MWTTFKLLESSLLKVFGRMNEISELDPQVTKLEAEVERRPKQSDHFCVFLSQLVKSSWDPTTWCANHVSCEAASP